MTSISPRWEARNRGFIPPSELRQWQQQQQSAGPRELRSRGEEDQPEQPEEEPELHGQTPPTPPPPPHLMPMDAARPPPPSHSHSHSKSVGAALFSFRNRSSNPEEHHSQGHQHTLSVPEASRAQRPPPPPVRSNSSSRILFTGPGPTPDGGGGGGGPPMPGRSSMSAAQPQPPLHPEIRSVVQLTLAHAQKVYFSGPLVRRIERQPDGQRPAKNEGWMDVWAQLGGTTLSIWDMKAIEEASKQGREVPPSYINVTDAFVQVLGAVTVPATPTTPSKKYTNVITLNTAGSNLLLFSCPSTSALISWAAALRLSAWEKSRLEEIYTAHLIRVTLNDGRNAPSPLIRGRLEGWVRVRVAGQVDWKRMWMVVRSSGSSSDGTQTPSTEGRPHSPAAPKKKRMSNFFSRESASPTSPAPEKPTISFCVGPKPKERKKPLLTLTDVGQAFAVYPERPELISRSTLIKLEGLLGDEETAGGMRGREGWLLVMPELEGGNMQAAEMLKCLIGIHDAFELYGRPHGYTWDPRDPNSLMYAYPIGHHKDLLFLDRELAETMDPRDDRTSAVRSRLQHILFNRMRQFGPENQARPLSSDQPPTLPPLPTMSTGDLQQGSSGAPSGLPQLPPFTFDTSSADKQTNEIQERRALTPITERSTRESATPTDYAQSPPSQAGSREHSSGAKASMHADAPSVIPEEATPSEHSSSVLDKPITSSPPPVTPEKDYRRSEDSFSVAGSRPDSKFSHEYRSRPSPSTDDHRHAAVSASDDVNANPPPPPPPPPVMPLSPSPRRQSYGPRTMAPPDAPASPHAPSGPREPPRPASPPQSVLHSPYSPQDPPPQTFSSFSQNGERASQDQGQARSRRSVDMHVHSQQAPTVAPSSTDHDFMAEAGALYYMQQMEQEQTRNKPKPAPPSASRRHLSSSEEDETDSEYESRRTKTPATASVTSQSQSTSSPKQSSKESPPMRRGTPSSQSGLDRWTSNTSGSAASSTPSIGTGRTSLARRPSGARAPPNARRQHGPEQQTQQTSSSSPTRRVAAENTGTTMATNERPNAEEPAASSPTAASGFDGPDADALAALSFLEREEGGSSRVEQQKPPAPPAVTQPVEEPSPAPSPSASAEGTSRPYRSSFAPSKQALERKAKSEAQQAALHKPGRAHGRHRAKAENRAAWNESSEEEEDDEEEDDEADSDDEPQVAPPSRNGHNAGMQLPNASARSISPGRRSIPPSELGAEGPAAYPHQRPPRNLPQPPPGSRYGDHDERPSPQARPARLTPDHFQEPPRQSQYGDPSMLSPQPRPQSERPPLGAARQSVWSQVLEPKRASPVPPENTYPQRDTFVQMEPPNASMTKAFTPQGLLSAGMQERQDRSAKRQEEVARETGASLINVPNKPPPPQTGLLGAITAHERERKREGGVGAALTEREREKRMAEERQRKLDELQRQQLEQMSQAGSMYGAPYPGFNPMMGNPMMMGMNPMMTGYMGYPGMMPGFGNPQHMFAAQQAAQAYQQAMMAFSASGSQAGGDGAPPQLNPMMTGGSMGGFDPRMSMMGMPMMGGMGGMSPMGMQPPMAAAPLGVQMTGTSQFDPRLGPGGGGGGFGGQPGAEFGGGHGQGHGQGGASSVPPRFSTGNSASGSPRQRPTSDPLDEPLRMSASSSPKSGSPRPAPAT